ncbi:MAG: protein-glutamate O-methyltransferase CheR [Candidatus Latescibacteria bacterium]|nr:protein-glutamate O-methyltransferase CheR [Candidatus Latescibacterota bacterium]
MSYDAAAEKSLELSDRQYSRLSRIIYDAGGIHLGDNKKELVRARLTKLLRKRNIGGFDAYLSLLERDNSDGELTNLLDAISTNVTHFFREHQHFDFLIQLAPEFSGRKGMRIWSAGCSSGEEPYTIAITLLEYFPEHQAAFHRIMASDISTKILAKARAGVYPMKSVEKIDASLVRKYFLKGKNKNEGLVKVKKQVTNLVRFERMNLIEPFGFREEFDIIFCRNVMIYFDSRTRESIVGKYYDALVPGGYLIIGHSESMNAFSHSFKYIKPTIYRKQV